MPPVFGDDDGDGSGGDDDAGFWDWGWRTVLLAAGSVVVGAGVAILGARGLARSAAVLRKKRGRSRDGDADERLSEAALLEVIAALLEYWGVPVSSLREPAVPVGESQQSQS